LNFLIETLEKNRRSENLNFLFLKPLNLFEKQGQSEDEVMGGGGGAAATQGDKKKRRLQKNR
jgi:hypothetical protein